ncbi:MAG: NADH-quinone oxidoreductase subunit NuoE [Clostridia bacterium]|nr:NADH-quinone oxidoreductase subunit NuoE [Clostridia bacterium]
MESIEEKARQVFEENKSKIDSIIQKYKAKPGALIPVLHEIQITTGFLPLEIQKRVAQGLDIPLSEVNSIVTFYSLFSEKPKGKYCIGVCKGTACYVKGSEKILKKLKEILKIEPGDTTDDGKFSIQVLRCLGACGLGPVITVNEKVYTLVTPDKMTHIMEQIEGGKDDDSL